MTRRVWAVALAGCLTGIPLNKERKLRRPPVPLRLSWKCGHRLRKRWQQLCGNELETLSLGKVGLAPSLASWLADSEAVGAGVDGVTLAVKSFHSPSHSQLAVCPVLWGQVRTEGRMAP